MTFLALQPPTHIQHDSMCVSHLIHKLRQLSTTAEGVCAQSWKLIEHGYQPGRVFRRRILQHWRKCEPVKCESEHDKVTYISRDHRTLSWSSVARGWNRRQEAGPCMFKDQTTSYTNRLDVRKKNTYSTVQHTFVWYFQTPCVSLLIYHYLPYIVKRQNKTCMLWNTMYIRTDNMYRVPFFCTYESQIKRHKCESPRHHCYGCLTIQQLHHTAKINLELSFMQSIAYGLH